MLRRLRRCIEENGFLFFVTFAALAIRLVWNLKVHPPSEYVFSDMAGYVGRANRLLRAPGLRHPDEAFFPYGTHYLLAAVKALFGKDNHAATAIYQAIAGALVVAFTYAIARRLARERLARERHAKGRRAGVWVPRIVGIAGAVYFPLISYGGYYTSETPYALFLTASAFLGLRLVDEGRRIDAWLLGIAMGLGAAVRPQIVMGLPFLGAFWLLRRRAFPRLRARTLVHVAVPLVLLLGLSTARAEYHTGRPSLVAQNGGVNWAFGRCHSVKIDARGGWFGPPSLGQLLRYERKHPDAWFKLDPAIGLKLKTRGYFWDEKGLYDLADRCVKRSGWMKQARYAITHVILLWGYNAPWPDAGQRRWRLLMVRWNAAHIFALLPPLAVAMVLAFRRRWARRGVIAMHIWGLLVVAMLYFGETRIRTPYDGLILVLAIDIYGRVALWAARLAGRIPR